MEDVPGSEESLVALDEQPALTGQNEEGLLIRLRVVNAALAGLEDSHIDPELREFDRRLAVLVGEPTRRAPRLRREPLGIAHVDDKPTLRDRGKPGAGVLKPRFVHAADSRSPSDGCLACASASRMQSDPESVAHGPNVLLVGLRIAVGFKRDLTGRRRGETEGRGPRRGKHPWLGPVIRVRKGRDPVILLNGPNLARVAPVPGQLVPLSQLQAHSDKALAASCAEAR